MGLGHASPQEDLQLLRQRLQDYLVKAAREAKRATSWISPDARYERALCDFLTRLFEQPQRNAFLKDFSAFAAVIAYFGRINSLVQSVLKLTAPGVPDFFQGTERLVLTLVDPDNRRGGRLRLEGALEAANASLSVRIDDDMPHFARITASALPKAPAEDESAADPGPDREQDEALDALAGAVGPLAVGGHAAPGAAGGAAAPAGRLEQGDGGAAKLYVTQRLLKLRVEYPALFEHQ